MTGPALNLIGYIFTKLELIETIGKQIPNINFFW
jgi:hypothetical protein